MARSNRTYAGLRAALGGLAVLAAACSGPGGAELGKDWAGATTFALTRVDGLVTVVGINPHRARAESLAVVPQQSDDTEAVSPHIVQLADGRWLVTVPRGGSGPDRRYLVNRKDHVLDSLPDDERLRRVLPGRTLVAEVAGLPDTKSAQQVTASSVLVKDPSRWTTKRELKIPGTIGLAASDPASDRICLGNDSKIFTADLISGEVTPVAVPSGLDVENLACPAGHPLIVGGTSSSTSGPVKATLTRAVAHTAVSVSGGRVDAVAATGSSVLIAAATDSGDTEMLELDTTTGKELHRARVKGVAASLDVAATSTGWLLYTEQTVTRVTPTTPRTTTFPLPGTLLDS